MTFSHMLVYIIYNQDQDWVEAVFSSKAKVRQFLCKLSQGLAEEDRPESDSLEDQIQCWCHEREFYKVLEWEIDNNENPPVDLLCNF